MSITVRLHQYIDKQGVTLSTLEKELGLGNSTLVKLFKEKRSIKSDILEKILDHLQVSDRDKVEILIGRNISNAVFEPQAAYARVEYATAEALQEDWGYVKKAIQDNHQMKIYKVLGNSMAPTLWDQDLVFCYDNGEEPIVNSYIYVIDSVHHGMLIKRVRQRDDGKIVVYGDNRDIAKSYPLDLHTEVKALYRVRCKLTWQLGAPDNRLSSIEERLNKLGV